MALPLFFNGRRKGEILKPKKKKGSREYRVKSPAITLGSMGFR
jgi:hypothetical protein